LPLNDAIRSQGPVFRWALFQKPQVNLARSSSSRIWLISACAGLAILQSSLGDSFASLFVALAAVAGALLTELLIDAVAGGLFKRRWTELPWSNSRDGSAVAFALVLSLLLPNRIPPVFAFLGAMFAMAVVKHSFGGLGANWLNPVLGGWLFVRFSWPVAFANALGDSPLGFFIENPDILFPPATGSGAVLTSLLNRTIFFPLRAELPPGYLGLFAYSGPGIIADRGVLGFLLGSILIIAGQASRFWIPLCHLGVYCLLVRLFGAIPAGGNFGEGDMLAGLFTGGVLAAAFILTTDSSTGPKSRVLSLAAALLGGALSFVFRYLGLEPYGAFFAAGLLNAFSPLLRRFETRFLYAGIPGETSRGGGHAAV
jgi:electron transport complex protein RnfD